MKDPRYEELKKGIEEIKKTFDENFDVISYFLSPNYDTFEIHLKNGVLYYNFDTDDIIDLETLRFKKKFYADSYILTFEDMSLFDVVRNKDKILEVMKVYNN